MKKRLILKVLGLLLLLPMFSGCNDTDDVAGIFTGKTWKLTYITKANGQCRRRYNTRYIHRQRCNQHQRNLECER